MDSHSRGRIVSCPLMVLVILIFDTICDNSRKQWLCTCLFALDDQQARLRVQMARTSAGAQMAAIIVAINWSASKQQQNCNRVTNERATGQTVCQIARHA